MVLEQVKSNRNHDEENNERDDIQNECLMDKGLP